MLTIYPVETPTDLPWNSPLHAGKFFNLKGMRWRSRKQRQALIIALALAWWQLVKRQRSAPGLVREEIFLTHLAKQAPDAKQILKHFFKIERTGFKFAAGQASPTIISPRKLGHELQAAIEALEGTVKFDPGPEPTVSGLTKSAVQVRAHRGKHIIAALEAYGREDLVPAVKWLVDYPQPINFYYKPSGKLQARDTSVWPIRAIETWPGWLRADLFGTVIDIDNAFSQFLMDHLVKKHENNPAQLRLKYPDLVAIAEDKRAFRAKLIEDVLKVPVGPDSVKVIKHVLMALANGSNASPQLFVGGTTRCEAANIIHAEAPWLSVSDQLSSGARLQRIAKQFRQAKKELCIYLFNDRPTAKNQKRIFTLYFNWEREARYKLWKTFGGTGLMLHDGIDGIISGLTSEELVSLAAKETGLKITARIAKEEGELVAPPLSLESV